MVKDYKDIGAPTALRVFSAKLAEVNLAFNKKFKPFDLTCARMDFKDKLETLEKESERRNGYVRQEDVSLIINDKDLEKYGDMSRFELIEDQEDYQDKVIEGSRTQVIIGHTLTYKCKERGHKLAVFIPIKEYNEMNSKKRKEE